MFIHAAALPNPASEREPLELAHLSDTTVRNFRKLATGLMLQVTAPSSPARACLSRLLAQFERRPPQTLRAWAVPSCSCPCQRLPQTTRHAHERRVEFSHSSPAS